MKNFALKLFSVLCAIGLSYYVQNPAQSSVVSFVASIEFKNVPESKYLLSPQSPQARVTIRGPSRFVQRVATGKHNFQIVTPEKAGNKFNAPLHESDLEIPAPVEVISIDPPEVEVLLDDRISREVPLVVPRLGSIAEDFKLIEFSVTPAKLKISGPRSELDKITSLESEPVDLTEVKGPLEQKVGVRIPSSFISVSSDHVQVKIEVVFVQKEKRFKNLPIELRDISGTSFSIFPERTTVEVSAGIKLIENLKAEDIIPYVRLAPELNDGDHIKLQVELPKGVSLVMVEPEDVLLRRSKEDVAEIEKPKR